MKRTVSILFALTLLFALTVSAFAVDPPTVALGSASCSIGAGTATVEIPVTIFGNTGLAGCELLLSYDPALTLSRVDVGTSLRSLVFTKPGDLSANPVKLLWDGVTADASNGTIAVLTFTVPTPSLASFDLSLAAVPTGVYDGDLNDVALTLVPGTITVVCPGHVWEDTAVTTPATCTAAGEKLCTCTLCGTTENQPVPALGHDLVHHDAQAPTCTEPGWTAYDTCSRCDYTTYEALPAAGHSWDAGVVTLEPTYESTGERLCTCTVCGATEAQTIPAYDPSELATFRPDGGTESARQTLADAFTAWIAAGYHGTVRLYRSPAASDLTALYAVTGGTNYYNTTSSETGSINALLSIGATASGGDLTLDLNGQAITDTRAVIATAPELDGFALTVTNGTLSTNRSTAMLLKGAGIVLRMDGVTVETTATAAASPIHECRWGRSCSILTNCTIRSNSRAAILLYTYSGNQTDPGTLLYYIKNSTLTSAGGSQYPIQQYKTSSASALRLCSIVLDGGNTYRTKTAGWQLSNLADCTHLLDGTPTKIGETDENGFNTFTTDGSASLLTAAESAAATLTVGDLSLPFRTVSDALLFADYLGSSAYAPVLTLNDALTVAAATAVGQVGRPSRFTLHINGAALTDESAFGLLTSIRGAEVAVTLTGSASPISLFAGVPALSSGGEYVLNKGRFFTEYSLNLEDSVKLNLYTTGSPDTVAYLQDGAAHYIASPDAAGAWVVDTLAAKEMRKAIDVSAMKAEGGKTYIDFVRNVSVQRYTQSNPASVESDPTVIETLNATLDTMMIYGKMAEKYFERDYTALSSEELSSIGLEAVPETNTGNLTHVERTVTGMGDHTADGSVTSGYWGSAAVLEDSICLKFYFYGAAFDDATPTVNGDPASLQTNGAFRFVQASVAAKDFDAPITVAVAGGSVTDSVEAYTARIASDSNAYGLAQALRAYGADAKRYDAAKHPGS